MLSFKTETGRFNLRVGGIAQRDGLTLLHRAPGDVFWTPPGGHIEVNETAAEALARELEEETGLVVSPGRTLWIAENFFTYRDEPIQQVVFFLAMTIEAETPLRFFGREGERELEYAWLDPAEPDFVIVPDFLQTGLVRLPSKTRHVVSRATSLTDTISLQKQL